MSWGRVRNRFRRRHRFRRGELKPITELRPGQQAIIKSVGGDQKVVQRLADLGLLPDTLVSLANVAPLNGPLEVVVRGTRLAIGREIAENLLVAMEGA